MQVVSGQASGGSFKIETPIAYRAKQRMCLLCFAATIFWLLIPVPSLFKAGPFPISSDLIASQLLLEIAHCIPLSPQSVSSHLISTHLMPSELLHLISSHPIWCLLSLSQLFSADHNGSHLFSSHLSFCHLFSSHLISSLLFRFSHFSTLLSSPQLM